MANERLFWISVLILPVLCLQVLGIAGLEFASNCSLYTFHMKSRISWEKSKNLCEKNGSKLVSMERLRAELNFLENQSEALEMNTIEYYIGLRRKGQKWIWVSDNSTLEETKGSHFPWALGEPSGNENCVKIWRKKKKPWTYVYDNVKCTVSTTNIGYICERALAPLKCGSNEPTSKTPKLPESTAPSPTNRSSVATATVPRSIAPSETQSMTKDYTDYKPHTIKGSTTMATKPTSKTPKLPESTAPSPIDRSFVATATVQRSIASTQSKSTTKDYTDYTPHTIKGSTTVATTVKPTDKAKSSLVELFNVKESSTLLVPTSFKKSITPITYTDTTDQEIVFNCSSYTFHNKSWITWEESNKKCEQSGSKLVSMEHLKAELTFLKNYLETLETETTEYYIGLRKDGQKWIWISDNSTLNKTEKGKFPWAPGQPNKDGSCSKMWLDRGTYVYDDIFCNPKKYNMGYICERSLTSSECGSNAIKPTEKARSSVVQSSESRTLVISTSFRKSITTITYTNQPEVLPNGIVDKSPDITTIILILLAVIILAVMIVFFLIFSRRRRNNKAKVSSSRKQSSDQTPHLHSSTELTVHFSMSQAREERFTIKTVTENNEEYAYAVVDESKRKSKCDPQGGPSSSEEGEVQPSSKDEHTAADQSALKESTEMCDKSNDQEEKGRHVYANVFVKENKAMSCKTAVSRDDSLDIACTKGSSAMGKDPVEHLNRSSLEQGKEINSKKATSGQDPNSATDCNDHFYAAVDKSKKKRMAPKKPLPYCSGHLMYADMSHLPTNKNGKVHRACASTVYADINHSAKRKVKTGFKPRLPTM